MGTKAVLDTNIFISALGWKGNSRRILQLAISGKIQITISTQQIKELERVLEYKKFKFTKQEKEKLLKIVKNISTIIEAPNKLKLIKEDPDDNVIVETAAISNSEYLVTGNKHIIKYKKYQKSQILTPEAFSRSINEK